MKFLWLNVLAKIGQSKIYENTINFYIFNFLEIVDWQSEGPHSALEKNKGLIR